jgi:hypothetical protein
MGLYRNGKLSGVLHKTSSDPEAGQASGPVYSRHSAREGGAAESARVIGVSTPTHPPLEEW